MAGSIDGRLHRGIRVLNQGLFAAAAKQLKPASLTEWDPQFKISISDQEKDPYALLQNLPGPNVKMTPDNMRELARYLVDAASICEQRQYRGLKHQLPLVNMQLKKQGMRSISLKSLK